MELEKPTVCMYRTDYGMLVVVATPVQGGNAHAVTLDGTVRRMVIPNREFKHLRQATRRDKPYPVKRALRIMKESGKMFGISKGAKKVMARIAGEIV